MERFEMEKIENETIEMEKISDCSLYAIVRFEKTLSFCTYV